MKVTLAHVRVPSTSGSPIDYALFESRSVSGSDSDNAKLLAQLTVKARASGLKVDQSALAFTESGNSSSTGRGRWLSTCPEAAGLDGRTRSTFRC